MKYEDEMYVNHVKLSDLKSIKSFVEKAEKFLFNESSKDKEKDKNKDMELYNAYNATMKSSEIKVNLLLL